MAELKWEEKARGGARDLLMELEGRVEVEKKMVRVLRQDISGVFGVKTDGFGFSAVLK